MPTVDTINMDIVTMNAQSPNIVLTKHATTFEKHIHQKNAVSSMDISWKTFAITAKLAFPGTRKTTNVTPMSTQATQPPHAQTSVDILPQPTNKATTASFATSRSSTARFTRSTVSVTE